MPRSGHAVSISRVRSPRLVLAAGVLLAAVATGFAARGAAAGSPGSGGFGSGSRPNILSSWPMTWTSTPSRRLSPSV
jgi:hypothetical protein